MNRKSVGFVKIDMMVRFYGSSREGMQIERTAENCINNHLLRIEQIHYHLINIKEHEKSWKYDTKEELMKKHLLLATGGTIAGTGKKGKTAAYHAGEIDIDSIIETIPEINEVAHIKEYQLMNIDSNEMTHEKWLILKNNIEEILSDDTIDGAVVTHGTDTLDETAYFLTLTLNTPKPVVLTGAMRPATATSADGPFNLYQAICLACHGESYNRGVLALFSNTIYSGREILKKSITLKSMHLNKDLPGCLGYMQDREVCFYTRPNK